MKVSFSAAFLWFQEIFEDFVNIWYRKCLHTLHINIQINCKYENQSLFVICLSMYTIVILWSHTIKIKLFCFFSPLDLSFTQPLSEKVCKNLQVYLGRFNHAAIDVKKETLPVYKNRDIAPHFTIWSKLSLQAP